MQFKLGDVVYLKSGGPAMTFSETREDGYVVAWWFTGDAGPFEAVFEPEMLELAADDEDGFYDAQAEYDAVYAKWVNGGKLTAEEWEIFETAGAKGTEDLSDAELDAIIADYERDRAR